MIMHCSHIAKMSLVTILRASTATYQWLITNLTVNTMSDILKQFSFTFKPICFKTRADCRVEVAFSRPWCSLKSSNSLWKKPRAIIGERWKCPLWPSGYVNFTKVIIKPGQRPKICSLSYYASWKVQFTKCSAWQSWTKTQMAVYYLVSPCNGMLEEQVRNWLTLVFLLSIRRRAIQSVWQPYTAAFFFFSLALFYCMLYGLSKRGTACLYPC